MASYPTSSSDNPNFSLTFTGDDLTQVDMVVDGPKGTEVTYRKTLTYSGDNLSTVSKWVLQ